MVGVSGETMRPMGRSDAKPPHRQALFVAGMHRSGTSAVTRTLSILGCALPDNLVPASRNDNDKGFWESRSVITLDDEMLESAGSYWDDWGCIRPEWFASPIADGFVSRAADLLQEAFRGAPLIVMKDPRICRLLPVWTKAAELAEYAPSVIIPVRNPIEVAQSLMKRSQIDTSVGLLIWLRHVLDAEVYSRDFPRSVVLYEMLMRDWRAWAAKVERDLAIGFPRLSPVADDEVREFLDPDLWRNRAADNFQHNGQVSNWVQEAYEVLRGWANGEQGNDGYARLDRVRQELQDVSPVFVRPIHVYRNARKELITLNKSHKDLSAENAELNGANTALTEEASKLRTNLAEKEESLNNLQVLLEKLQKEASSLKSELKEGDARIREAHKQAAHLREDASELELSLAEKTAVLEKVQEQLAIVTKEYEAVAGERTLLFENNTVLKKEVSEAKSILREKSVKLMEVQDQLNILRREKEAASLKAKSDYDAISTERTALKLSLEQTLSAMAAQGEGKAKAEQLVRELQLKTADLERKYNHVSDQLSIARRSAEELSRKLDQERKKREYNESARFKEIAQITRMAANNEDEVKRLNQVLVALVTEMSSEPPKLAFADSFRPGKRRAAEMERVREMLTKSGIVDRDWYVASNPDVKAQGVDPVMHYLLHGIREGRAPNPTLVK